MDAKSTSGKLPVSGRLGIRRGILSALRAATGPAPGPGSTVAPVRRLMLATLLCISSISGLAFAEGGFAPIEFWNVPNYYSGGWYYIRYSNPEDAFLVEWYEKNFTCATGSNVWDFVDVFPVDAGFPRYPLGTFYGAHYMFRYCSTGQTQGPNVYPSIARRYAACSNDGPFEASPEQLDCSVPPDGIDPEKNRGRPCDPNCTFGDPINVGVGNKFEEKVEYQGTGPYPLRFSWTYNSSGAPIVATPQQLTLGAMRVHSYARAIHLYAANGLVTANVIRPQGNIERFNESGGTWRPDADIVAALESIRGEDGAISGWVYRASDGSVEFYGGDGLLEKLRSPEGFEQQLAYDDKGRVASVRDPLGRELGFVYDKRGYLETLLTPDGQNIRFTYGTETPANLKFVTYADGRRIGYLYNETGFVSSSSRIGALTGVVDETGARYSSTTYDSAGRATSTYLAEGLDKFQVSYLTGGTGKPVKSAEVVTPTGQKITQQFVPILGRTHMTAQSRVCDGCFAAVLSTSFDANGRRDVVTNENGTSRDFNYNEYGLEVGRTEAKGTAAERVIRTDWHPIFRKPTERRTYDAAGVLVADSTWTYNDCGQVLTSTQSDPATGASRTTTTAYCEQADVDAPGSTCPVLGLLKSVDGSRTDLADLTVYAYYPATDESGCDSGGECHRRGDLIRVVNALGQATEYLRYDRAGRALSIRDPNGVVTEFDYHPRGWLTARKVRGPNPTSEADDAITRIEYAPTGLVSRITQPDGAFTQFTYDAAHRLVAVSDSLGHTIGYTLDAAGHRIREDTRDPQGALTRTLARVYNQLGQVRTELDAQAHPTDHAYDANGNALSVTDALGRATENAYDPLDRLSHTLQDAGGLAAETRYAYDALDNLVKVTDPKGLATDYAYDALGNLLSLRSPDTGTTAYTYDAAGNRTAQTDARGVTARYRYDALNRLTGIAYPDPALDVAFGYDTVEPVCTAGETFAQGRLSGFADASGRTQLCYDRLGNVVRKVQTVAEQVRTLRFAYDLAGRLTQIVYPSGTVVRYTRRADGRIEGIGVTPAGAATETPVIAAADYLPFGPVTRLVYGNGQSQERDYDGDYAIGRLRSTQPGGLDIEFATDAVDNLVQLVQGTDGRRLGYDGLNRLTQVTALNDALLAAYAYDATGNRVQAQTVQGVEDYAYAPDSHHLTAVAGVARQYDAAGNTLDRGDGLRLVYDARNRLSEVQRRGRPVRQYDYNARGEQVRRHLEQIEANRYLYGEGGQVLVDERISGHGKGKKANAFTETSELIWLDDLPVALVRDGVVYYIEPDHLGSPRAVLDPGRNVAVWTWSLLDDPFGATLPQEDPDGDRQDFVFDLRFPGQVYEAETGLHYNYFRDYEPGTGRYVESDPIGLRGGINPYAYVDSDPLSFSDASGLAKNRADGYWGQCSQQDMRFCDQMCGLRGWSSCRKWVRKGTEIIGGGVVTGPVPAALPSCNCNELECGENCQKVLKATLNVVTGTIILIWICVTSPFTA